MAACALPEDVAAAVERGLSPLRVASARPVDGGSQVSVWRTTLDGHETVEVAVRLVGRSRHLLERQAAAIDRAYAMGAPVARILSVEELDVARGPSCVVTMEWAAGAHPLRPGSHAYAIGSALSRLHRALRGLERGFLDRPLTLDDYGGYVRQLRSAGARTALLLQAIERHQHALRTWDEYYGTRMPHQLLHGDMHGGNVVVGPTGPRLIDFDKMMVGPRVFDLAKFVATTCFRGRGEATQFARTAVDDLVNGYTSVEPLSDVELASLIPLCMIVHVESTLAGLAFGSETLVQHGLSAGGWWARTSCRGKLSRLRTLRRTSICAHQLQLFTAV